ncbi:hypothetical protein [Pseudomonas phage vB_PaeM_RP7]|uniref:Uncharacterized protein n=1 Tax=Pseudomonas phage PAP-JP TaxID=2583508 RepID=A0A5C1K6P7_9CAUD|nr:hypothetical protein PAPJP_122 [Pseudomonas phage PAP-JP]UKH48018.1 MAG: hypothetical protein [Pseudomonas phage RP4]WAB56707.1 hypothetical protein [Pseudomonas phage vB_PaeM_RP15]WAB56993.1 hypothetical protein [Pseudomonas phage vB_PaeM_RP6]WAB57098.1 hypothetical protein [Pseudomonas phage vB_PaeM_RP7]WAB57235.1 hypothetical protein [Pseudomonas phage vB_PaeM_RP8]WAB57503.1 hypothetical protein [Pseudomonas phage vB_PaeM_RP9]WAB57620.1 hypothetical protein [Pseudomonas phage vB_PaeM_R
MKKVKLSDAIVQGMGRAVSTGKLSAMCYHLIDLFPDRHPVLEAFDCWLSTHLQSEARHFCFVRTLLEVHFEELNPNILLTRRDLGHLWCNFYVWAVFDMKRKGL